MRLAPYDAAAWRSNGAEPCRRRRSLTHRALLDLGRRLEELERYRAAHGTYDVPRAGDHAELGDWLDKLRETYAKRPDGHRIRCVIEHAPALHAYLMAWHATRLPRAACRAVPFWISACWAYDFMRGRARAPSQASSDMSEVAQARWLSRWSSPAALAQLSARPFRKTVAEELSAIACHLRSAPPFRPGMVLPPKLAQQFLQTYDTLAALASEEVQPCVTSPYVPMRAVLPAILARRARFWPSWAEWRALTDREP